MPPSGGVSIVGAPPPSAPLSSPGVSARSREETLDGTDFIEVVEGSRPPPPPEAEAAPLSRPAPISQGPASQGGLKRPTPPLSTRGLEANPFLTDAAPGSAPSPISTPATVSAIGRAPSSGRGLQSTVTGLATPSDAPVDAPPELDGSRRRRAGWFVGLALVATATAVTLGVVQSRGGFKSAAQPDPVAAPTNTAPRTGTGTAPGMSVSAPTPPPASAAATVSASAAASSSADVSPEAIDPSVTKKPTPSAVPPATGPRPRKTGDAVEIEIPDPDREIRLPRGQ
jgi:hypothetical protein